MEKHFSVEGLYQENEKIKAVYRSVHNKAYLIRAYMETVPAPFSGIFR
jgi:hypothetical protein